MLTPGVCRPTTPLLHGPANDCLLQTAPSTNQGAAFRWPPAASLHATLPAAPATSPSLGQPRASGYVRADSACSAHKRSLQAQYRVQLPTQQGWLQQSPQQLPQQLPRQQLPRQQLPQQLPGQQRLPQQRFHQQVQRLRQQSPVPRQLPQHPGPPQQQLLHRQQGQPQAWPQQQQQPQQAGEPGPAASAEEMEMTGVHQHGSDAGQRLGREPEEVCRVLQVVSLGSSCAVKITLRRLGLGEATMPFDWMRTRARALIHWIDSEFDGFFRMQERVELTFQNKALKVFRSHMHSFWHNDLDDDGSREQLWRRVARFLELAVDPAGRSLLFVRSVAGTAELSETEFLFEALQRRFESCGRTVYLLVVMEDQGLVGPILHSKYPRIMFWVQPLFEGKLSLEPDLPAPYEDAVSFAVRRVLGDPQGLHPGGQPGSGHWPQVSQASAILAPGGPLRQAGLKPTEFGIFVGDVLVKGDSEEIFYGAFTGLDRPKGGVMVVPPPSQAQAGTALSEGVAVRTPGPRPFLPAQNLAAAIPVAAPAC